jgi:hypothetical protein
MALDMGLAVPGAKVEAGYREWFRRRMIASPLGNWWQSGVFSFAKCSTWLQSSNH